MTRITNSLLPCFVTLERYKGKDYLCTTRRESATQLGGEWLDVPLALDAVKSRTREVFLKPSLALRLQI